MSDENNNMGQDSTSGAVVSPSRDGGASAYSTPPSNPAQYPGTPADSLAGSVKPGSPAIDNASPTEPGRGMPWQR